MCGRGGGGGDGAIGSGDDRGRIFSARIRRAAARIAAIRVFCADVSVLSEYRGIRVGVGAVMMLSCNGGSVLASSILTNQASNEARSSSIVCFMFSYLSLSFRSSSSRFDMVSKSVWCRATMRRTCWRGCHYCEVA